MQLYSIYVCIDVHTYVCMCSYYNIMHDCESVMYIRMWYIEPSYCHCCGCWCLSSLRWEAEFKKATQACKEGVWDCMCVCMWCAVRV